MPIIPTIKWINTYHLYVNGAVKNKLTLTLKELKNDFEPVEVTAVMQCGGNSRSAFHPTPVGIQWGNGAMGCAKFKGVRLKDILQKALPKDKDYWIIFHGNDKPIKRASPRFERALHVDESTEESIGA
jgi:sulfoxide reductase catalytic subunit YedY